VAEPRPGLTSAEARARLAIDGPNALPVPSRGAILALLAGVLREPMFLLLLAAVGVYLVLGDAHQALVLAASLVVVVAITVIQERRTERALEALRDLSSPRALVRRDGRETRIAGSEVVRGDLLLLREGDRVAADARLLEAHGLSIDESLLTGESVPVDKGTAIPGAESSAYSGTLVVRGTALAEVTATGPRSEMGRIGASLARLDPGRTRLEEETGRVVRVIAAVALALCVAVALLYYVLRGDAVAGVLAGLTLAMALLPEEFPVVLTIFLALGAWRISRHGVLTRRMPAIEMLGATTVLCCDKTGTLTENRMTVVGTWSGGRWHERAPDGMDHALLETAALACEPTPFDPMERALLDAAAASGPGRAAAVLEQRYPLAADFLAVCHGWRLPSGERVAALKGAPETVLGLCALATGQRAEAHAAAVEAAARGLRMLGVARAAREKSSWPANPGALAFTFAGFVALADPLRSTVPGAIALCRRAGIRVVMITGDHPATARAIAAQAGIDATHVLAGTEIDSMDAPALTAAARSTQVFARVTPAQKLRLVEALRAAGEVVAMTGDGVNDAPALRAAHIGVAMGRRGTDVAREAAALVLLEDDFTSIVGTVRLGRRIHDNIRNAMRYLIAVHVPLAGMAFVPLIAGWPLFVLPVHVVFLEFVIDPACTIVFEAERSEPHIMDRPPRPASEPLFGAAALMLGLILGAGVLVVVAVTYGWALAAGLGDHAARALAFAALVCGNLGLILANRSHALTAVEVFGHPNPALWWIVGGTLASLCAAIYVPGLADLFAFAPVKATLLAAACAAGFASVAWYDGWKLARRARAQRFP
jgi:Ca2+-transporting ATPase